MRPHIEIKKLFTEMANGYRIVFLYSYQQDFAAAARALKIRGFLKFGEDPIPGKFRYKAFYADFACNNPMVPEASWLPLNEKIYAAFAMLVRDFYSSDLREKFEALFPFDCKSIQASIKNPNSYLEANRAAVDALIEKYRDTATPLEFYGTRFQAESTVLMINSAKNPGIKGVICADDQGMGKSRASIIATKESMFKRSLVVAPKTARVGTWPDELKLTDPNSSFFLGNHEWLGNGNAKWVVVSWDHLRQFPGIAELIKAEKTEDYELMQNLKAEGYRKLKEFLGNGFDLCIADEAHKAQDKRSQRSIALAAITKYIPKFFALTGTPATKRAKSIFNLLRLSGHPLGKSETDFLARYDPQQKLTGAKKKQRLDELHALLRDIYIRHEKSQTNLPLKMRYVQKIVLTDDQKKSMEKMWDDYCKKPEVKKKMESPDYPLETVKQGKMHEFCSLHKIPWVIEWAEDLIEAGEKVIIFTTYTETWKAYMKHFGNKAVGVYGGTKDADRAEARTRFQTDPSIKAYIGNTVAAGESQTLTAACQVGFNDITYIPKDQLQAEDRALRGGQTKNVSCNYFLADTEWDEKRFDMFIHDKEVVQAITNLRNPNGEIDDAEWGGDISGTAVEDLAQKELVKTDFDWEDAGEEPPKEEKKKKAGWEYARDKKRQKNKGVTVQTPDKDPKVICTRLNEIFPHIKNQWERNFVTSVTEQYRKHRSLSIKQKAVANRIIKTVSARLPKPVVVPT